MAIYAVAHGRINDREQFEQYVGPAVESLEAHGVEVVTMTENATMIEGTSEFPRVILLRFASKDAFYKWYESPEYQAAKAIRVQCCDGTFALLDDTA